jgi:hypothetical protein
MAVVWAIICGLTTVCALAFAAYGIALAIELWRPLPAADQWEGVTAYQDWTTGALSFSKLLAPHNEHRIPLTKLAILIDFGLFEGRSIFTHCLLLLVHGGLGVALGPVATRGFAASTRALGVAAGIAFLVSPVQIHNLILPFDLGWAATGLSGLGAFWWTARLADPLRQHGRAITTVLAATATVLAVYSSANGLAVAPMVAVSALVLPVARASRVALVSTAVLSVASYFVDYAAWSAAEFQASRSVDHGALYFLGYVAAFLGSVDPHDFETSLVLGSIGLGIWASVAYKLLSRFRSAGTLDPSLVALFLLATLAIATAAMIALGRGGMGDRLALSSRYTTWSVLFWGSLAGCVGRFDDAAVPRVAKIATMGLTLALLIVSYVASGLFIRQSREYAAATDVLSAELRAGRIVPEHLTRIYPKPEAIVPLIELLRARRLSIFAD